MELDVKKKIALMLIITMVQQVALVHQDTLQVEAHVQEQHLMAHQQVDIGLTQQPKHQQVHYQNTIMVNKKDGLEANHVMLEDVHIHIMFLTM